jgi:hypothetical protein
MALPTLTFSAIAESSFVIADNAAPTVAEVLGRISTIITASSRLATGLVPDVNGALG